MARDFSSRTDTDKTELAKYPDGRIKEGIADGTLWDEAVTGDFYQVFLKAMRDAGITPNGLPDNETNGWQMFDACFGTTKVPITTFYNGFGQVDIGLTQYQQLCVIKENGGRLLRICGWINIGTSTSGPLDMFLLPVGYRPTKISEFSIVANDQYIVSCQIKLDGTISQRNSVITNYSGYINVLIPLD